MKTLPLKVLHTPILCIYPLTGKRNSGSAVVAATDVLLLGVTLAATRRAKLIAGS